MVSTTSFMEDIEKFIVNVKNASAEDLIASVIVIFLVGAFIKNRGVKK